MVSYGDVRRWRAEPLHDAEIALGSTLETLLGLADELAGAKRPARWRGPAADAAALAHDRTADGMEHVVAGLAALRRALGAAAAGVRGLTATIATLDSRAEAEGFSIDEAGRVTDRHTEPSLRAQLYGAMSPLGGLAQLVRIAVDRANIAAELTAGVVKVQSLAASIDSALADVLRRVERGEITDGGATTLADAAAAGRSQAPNLPGRPRDPQFDIGAGEHDVDPWYSTGDDEARKKILQVASPLAGLFGWERAADLLSHYLGNSGRDVTVSPADMMRDMPGFRRLVELSTHEQMRKLAGEAAENGTYGQPVQFTSDWKRDDLKDDNNGDWFNAIGTVEYAVTGVATVFPPDTPGGAPRVKMDYQTHVFDRYNWDYGKTATLGPVTMAQAPLADLHRAGVAKEFNTVGTSEVMHFTGPVPAP